MMRRALVLCLLTGCAGAPHAVPVPVPVPGPTPVAGSAAAAKGPLPQLLAIADDDGLQSGNWIGGGQIAALSRRHLWVLDPKHADLVRLHDVGDGGWLVTDPGTDVFALNLRSENRFELFRGASQVPLPRAGSNPPVQVSAVAPDGKHVVVETTTHDHRVFDLETGAYGGVLPDDYVRFDPSGQYLLGDASVYDLAGRRLHVFKGETGSGDWMDGSGFVFTRSGFEAFEPRTQQTRRVALPCLAGEHSDLVDDAHHRIVRACGNRVYDVAWPSGTLQRIRLPERLRLHPPHHIELTPSRKDSSYQVIAWTDSGSADGFRIADGQVAPLPDATEALEGQGCQIDLPGPRLDRALWCHSTPQPGGPLTLAAYGDGLGVADVDQDREIAHYGPPLTMQHFEEPYARVEGALEVHVGTTVKYRFASTALPASRPPRPLAECANPPLMPIWQRPKAALYRRVDATQCLCTSVKCTDLPAEVSVLDAREDLTMVASALVFGNTTLQLGAHQAELTGACTFGALGENTALLLCRKEGPYVLHELRLADLVEVSQRDLGDRLAPTSIDAFRGGILVSGSAHRQRVLGFGSGACPGVHCTDSTLVAHEAAGVLQLGAHVELAGDRAAAERIIWCASAEPAVQGFTSARAFPTCAAAFQ